MRSVMSAHELMPSLWSGFAPRAVAGAKVVSGNRRQDTRRAVVADLTRDASTHVDTEAELLARGDLLIEAVQNVRPSP